MTDDDEIEVEAIDTSILDETVEITYRGDLGVVLEVVNVIDLGLDTIVETPRIRHPGWVTAALAVNPTMEVLAEELQTEELLNLPEGVRETDAEEIQDALDVQVTWPEREGEDLWRWTCRRCGQSWDSPDPPEWCSKCGNDSDFSFERVEADDGE